MSRNKSVTWSDQHHGPDLRPLTAPLHVRHDDRDRPKHRSEKHGRMFPHRSRQHHAILVELNAVKRTADGFAYVDVDKVPPELMTAIQPFGITRIRRWIL